MNPRERILAIGVGSVLVLGGIQFGVSKFRAALQVRQNRIQTLDDQVLTAQEKVLQGAYADRMMGEYLARSLPSDLETAKSNYQKWLLLLPELVGLENSRVQSSGDLAMGDLYHRFQFKVTGTTDQQGWVEWLHLFYAKDWLHRITDMSVQKAAADGKLNVNLTIEVIALKAAQPDLPARAEPSPLVESFADYADPILNRNLFSPPNQPPQFTSPARHQVTLGQPPRLNVAADDPEKHRVQYSIVGEAPAGLQIDPASGAIRWAPTAVGDYSFVVAAVDNGFPARRTEQQVTIAVQNPPPPQPQRAPDPQPPAFDEASQTVLTALVQGSGDWTAWMRVRTQGTTLKLRPGDKFEIGKLSGQVVDVNARFVTLEIDGNRFELRPAGNLAEAAKAAHQAAQPATGNPAADQTAVPPAATPDTDAVPPAETPAAEEVPATPDAAAEPIGDVATAEAPAAEEPVADSDSPAEQPETLSVDSI